MPDLYIITGSNGAGKSSIGPEYLPYDIKNNYIVFDGDLLFVSKSKELFPHVVRSPKEAKKLAYQFVSNTFDNRVEDAIKNNKTFVYEGHFTNDATWITPKRFKDAGYVTHLLFFGLSNPDLSQLRVTDRVADGGHYVDRLTIEANFRGNLEKLNQYHYLIDHLTIIDTSEINHKTIAAFFKGKLMSSISPSDLPWWFIELLPALTRLISE